MSMIQKKVCLLGAFGVGKTSLVRRFVSGIFSDRYLSTMGVKIDRKRVCAGGREVNMMLWDIHGEEAYKKIPDAYLRGASGVIMVADGTRPETVDTALELLARVERAAGPVARVFLVNKHDLSDEWAVGTDDLDRLGAHDAPLFLTSAKTGEHVEPAFLALAERMVA